MIVTMIMMNPKRRRCAKCGYEWTSRVEEPEECPNCKSRRWKG